MHGDNIAMLDTQIVPYHAVHPGAPIIQIVVSQDYEDCIFSLLSFHQHSISAKELKVIHRGVRQSNDGVVIIDSISNTVGSKLAILPIFHDD